MAPRARNEPANDYLPPPRKDAVPSSVTQGLQELDDDEGDDGGFEIPDAEAIR